MSAGVPTLPAGMVLTRRPHDYETAKSGVDFVGAMQLAVIP